MLYCSNKIDLLYFSTRKFQPNTFENVVCYEEKSFAFILELQGKRVIRRYKIRNVIYGLPVWHIYGNTGSKARVPYPCVILFFYQHCWFSAVYPEKCWGNIWKTNHDVLEKPEGICCCLFWGIYLDTPLQILRKDTKQLVKSACVTEDVTVRSVATEIICIVYFLLFLRA
jgi:hypothetical protein